MGGSRCGLSYSIIRYIQLSGMAQEQRCPDNRGSTVSVRIIELTSNAVTSVSTLIGHENVAIIIKNGRVHGFQYSIY